MARLQRIAALPAPAGPVQWSSRSGTARTLPGDLVADRRSGRAGGGPQRAPAFNVWQVMEDGEPRDKV